MKTQILILLLVFQFFLGPVVRAETAPVDPPARLPISALLGEKLTYNISFLWFRKIARGEILLEPGEKSGTYLATLTARTRGVAAFFTGNRVETYAALMEEGPDGLLRPLVQTSDTKKDDGEQETHRQTTYTFNFSANQVSYHKTINGVAQKKHLLPMDEEHPTYDFLTAFYNLRLGRLGSVEMGRDIKLAAFSRKGPEEIVICRLFEEGNMQLELSEDLILCKVLMDPDTFNTKGRDVYVGFDDLLRPQIAVIKNVIGMGDVRGELVHITEPGLTGLK